MRNRYFAVVFMFVLTAAWYSDWPARLPSGSGGQQANCLRDSGDLFSANQSTEAAEIHIWP
jgi:hypothetical protein